jgi:glycosyltransferase involved in cell wall biosynthesis
MRILFIAPEFPPKIGGMETYASEIIKKTAEDPRIDKILVLIRNTLDSEYIFNKKIIPKTKVEIKSSLVFPGEHTLEDIKKEYEQFRPDIIHILNAGFSPVVEFAGDSRTIITAHGKDFLDPWSGFFPEKILKWLFRCDNIISVSRYVKEKILQTPFGKEYPSDKISVAHHGVDMQLFFPEKQPDETRKGLGVKPDDFLLVSACRINPGKNIELSISALDNIYKRSPSSNVKLLVIGPIDDLAYFIKLKNAISPDIQDKVIFLNEVDHQELRPYYNIGDAFLMVSRSESLGIAFLEAGACGLPLIGPTSGGAGEIIANEKNGFILDPDDTGSLAEKIILLSSNKAMAEEMGKESIKLAKRFTWTKNYMILRDSYFPDR